MADPILDPTIPQVYDPASEFAFSQLSEQSSPESLLGAGYQQGVYRQQEMPPPGPSVDDMVAKWGGYGGDDGYKPGDLTQPNMTVLDQVDQALSQQFLDPNFIEKHPNFPDPTGASSRGFNGDESINDYVDKAGKTYEDTMFGHGARAGDVAAWVDGFKKRLKRGVTAAVLHNLMGSQPRYQSEWEKQPFFGDIIAKNHQRHVKQGWDAINAGKGDMNDYLQVAGDLADQNYQENQPGWRKGVLGALSVAKPISEIGQLSGVAKFLAPGDGAGALARAFGGGAAFTAVQFPLSGAQDLLAGKPLGEVARDEFNQLGQNSMFAGMGLFGPKGSPPGLIKKGLDYAWDTVKMLAAGEVSKEALHGIGTSDQGSALLRLARPDQTNQERAENFREWFYKEGGPLAVLNVAMKAMHAGEAPKPKKLSDQMVREELERLAKQKEVMPRDADVVPVRGGPAVGLSGDMTQAPPTTQPQAPAEPAAPASPNEYIQTDKGWFSRREAEAQGLLPKAGGAEPAATPSPAQPPPPEPRKPLADFSDQDVRDMLKGFGRDARGSRETLLKRLHDVDQGRTIASLESLSASPAKVAEAQEAPKTAPAAPEAEKAPEAAPAPERRQDVERRRAVAEMSPEEMRKELLTNPVTGLPNRRAFDEAGPAKAVGMSDADGLKALNDRFGYEAGDTMLRAKAEALKEAGLDAYHEKGDEFLYRGGSKEELGQKLERARSILRDKIIHTEKAGDFKGADFSYGHGADRAEAETGLKAHKAQREAAGERARGELRGITQVGAGPGGQDLGRAAREDHGETPAPRVAVGPHPLEPNVRNALADPEVATRKEIWQHVNQQRQKKGLAKVPSAQVFDAIERMKGRGDVIMEPGQEGEDPLHVLKESWGDVTPESVEKAKAELEKAKNGDIVNKQRNGGEPASVRRAFERDLQKAQAVAGASVAAEEAATGQGAGPAGVPEVSDSPGAAAERPEGAAAGGGPASGDIVAEAKRIRANDREDVADHNAIMRAVWARLKPFGVEARDYKKNFEDASKVPELDKAADYWAQARPDKFVRPGEEPSDILHDMLRKGMRKPMSSQESLEKAEDYLRSQANPEEHANAQQEGRLAGYSAEAVRQHVARIEAEVRAEAEAEERAEKEREHEQAETAAERAAIEQPATSGEPAGREPWDLIAGESGAVNLKALAKFFGFKEEEPTGIANAMAAKERQKARLPPVQQPSPVGHSYPELRDQVLQIARTDPTRIDRLVEELQKKSRPVTDLEDALLLHRENDVRNQYDEAAHKLVQAQAGGDAMDLQGAQATERDVREKLRDITDVTKQVGTETARGLAARRMMVNRDFSLANMVMQWEAAKGEPLSGAEHGIAAQHFHEIQDTGAKQQQAESALAEEGGGHKSPLFPEMTKAQVAAEGAKDDWRRIVEADRQKNLPLGQRMEDLVDALRRAFVISNPKAMVKIIAASAERMITTPLEEAVGSVWNRIPGIAKISAMAPREGRGLNLEAEKMAAYDGVTQGLKDAWQTAKKGYSENDTLYGDTSKPRRPWLDWIGALHGAGKAPAARNEFTRSFLKRIDAAAAEGKDTTSPASLMQFGMDAYRDSQAAKFQQQNWLAQGMKRFLRPGADAGVPERALKGLGRLTLPVVTVPTNLIFEASKYAFGLGTGSAQAGIALARGIEGLKPAQAESIMQQLKKGTLGAALLAAGYYLGPKVIGGFYSGKRKPDDPEAGSVGGAPAYTLHNPALEMLQMGSTFGEASKKEGITEGAAKAILGLEEQIPIVRDIKDIGGKALSPNAKIRGRYFGEFAKSLAVPQLVQWLAGRLDTKETATSYANPLTGEVQKRRPVGVLQHVQEGVPGLRNLLPKR